MLHSTDNLLKFMREYRIRVVNELNANVWLESQSGLLEELNTVYAKYIPNKDDYIQSRLEVISHVINVYIPYSHTIIDRVAHRNFLKEFNNK